MALTKSGQLALRNKARTELERLESLENDKETIEKVEASKGNSRDAKSSIRFF